MKKAGIIFASALLVLVIILLTVRNKVSDKTEGGGVSTPPSSPSTQGTVSNARSYDVGMYRIKDASLLDYSVPILQSKGTISDKVLLLDGTQVVYLLQITLDELNSSTVKFYCSYEVFSSVDINTRVNVSYQKLTESSFSVYNVTAE